MKRIGILSDTHGNFHPSIAEFFNECSEIWHAGDIGNLETAMEIAGFKPLKAVTGNIDDQVLRSFYPVYQEFTCEKKRILMLHIGGYPGRYSKDAKQLITELKPDVFICGHSHILRIIYDKKHDLLYINPGAAGKSGFHKVITAIRCTFDGDEIKDLEIKEIER